MPFKSHAQRKAVMAKLHKKFRVTAYSGDNPTRTEIINTKTNILFQNIRTKKGVKNKYERFWSTEKPKVKVIRVEEIK